MTTPTSLYARVGALILAAIGLGVGFVLFFTAGQGSGNNAFFETYLRESVQGLEPGAAVRYRGVQIGRVSEIGLVAVAYPPPGDAPMGGDYQRVLVRFAIDRSRIGEFNDIEQVVGQGLRLRLSSQGITGVAYLEADFVDPTRYPVVPPPWQPKTPVVPAIPSTVAQVQDAAETILKRIEQAPLEQLLADVTTLVQTLRDQTGPNGDAGRTLREAALLLGTLRMQVEQADVPGLMAELRGAASDTRALVNSREVKSLLANGSSSAAELRASLARLPAAITGLEQTVRAARSTTTDLNADLAPILRDLRATTSALRDVAETMRRSPSQTIFGAPPPAPNER